MKELKKKIFKAKKNEGNLGIEKKISSSIWLQNFLCSLWGIFLTKIFLLLKFQTKSKKTLFHGTRENSRNPFLKRKEHGITNLLPSKPFFKHFVEKILRIEISVSF